MNKDINRPLISLVVNFESIYSTFVFAKDINRP